ncbi:MAG: hypothetical protein ACK58L_22840 [Planctomycetota bacterium]
MALDHEKFSKLVVVAALLSLVLPGCSETPTVSAPTATSAAAPAVIQDEVDSGDENGPAVSKPLDEPPVN